MNRAPSVKAFNASRIMLECEPSLIRAIWQAKNLTTVFDLCPASETWFRSLYSKAGLTSVKRWAVDHAGGFSGVECVGIHRRTRKYVYYCNAGDTYNTTLIFHGTTLSIGCWGDLIERRIVWELTGDEF